MSMPTVIAYLASQEKKGGGKLCRPGRLQFVFPIIPPNYQLNFSIEPPFGAYAAIKYGMSYEALPGVIYLETSQGGDMYIRGTIEADHMREMVPYFIIYTVGSPIVVLLRNTSPLCQRAVGTQYMVIIQTEEDLAYVKDLLEAQSSLERIRLQRETNQLLRAIAGGAPAPAPPIT